jgi:hypothetical protein
LKIPDDEVALCLRQKPGRSQVAVTAEGVGVGDLC